MVVSQEKIRIIDQKILSNSPTVKEKIAFGNSLGGGDIPELRNTT